MNLLQNANDIKSLMEKAVFIRKYVNRKLLDRERLYHVAQKSINSNLPIAFVGLWGAKNKCCMDYNDEITIRQLENFSAHVRDNFPEGCEWKCILCDVHAVQNGYNIENIRSYLEQIREQLQKIPGFQTVYMGSLWEKFDIQNKIEEKLGYVRSNWGLNDLAKTIEHQAKKHNVSNRSFRESAQYYYSMRAVEAELMEKLYPDAVLFSFSTDRLSKIYPKLPCIYLWSKKRGVSEPPWLMKEDMKG